MMRLTIRRTDPCDASRFTVDECGVLYLYGRYGVTVIAREFAEEASAAATLGLYDADGQALAVTPLVPDPRRRGCRTGELDLSSVCVVSAFAGLRSREYARLGQRIPRTVDVKIIAAVGGTVVVSGEIPVELVPGAAIEEVSS